jgi:hypothetical protein
MEVASRVGCATFGGHGWHFGEHSLPNEDQRVLLLFQRKKQVQTPKFIGQSVATGNGREKRACPATLTGQADKET